MFLKFKIFILLRSKIIQIIANKTVNVRILVKFVLFILYNLYSRDYRHID